jgi:hypothetical protein
VTNIAVACTTVPYTVGGKIAGLASGSSVVLSDDGSFDTLVVTGNGAGSQGFTFGATIPSGGTYDVAVVSSPTAPVAQTCVISSGGGPGTVTNANIVNVSITCTTLTFTIEGTVSGIAAGATVSAVDNGDTADTQTLTPTTTNFAFAVQVASGQAYDVSLTLNSPPTAPDPQTCTVTGGSTGGGTGVVADSNVNLTVTCTCTNGVTIPAQCATGTDPETGAQWVTCGPSSCYQAWFSYTGGTGGTFHGTQICKSFGYPEMNEYGTADAVCDESPLAPDPTASCSTPGTENFNQTGYIGTDTHGPEVGGMVMWHCGPG